MDKCIICLDNIQHSFCYLNCDCNNIYHSDCVNNWLQINRKCPTCNKIFPQLKKSNLKLLEKAMFYDSIGKYDLFNKKHFKRINNYLK